MTANTVDFFDSQLDLVAIGWDLRVALAFVEGV